MPNKTWHGADVKSAVLLCLIIGLVFLPCLQAEFLYWDDDAHILENPQVFSTAPHNLISIFQSVVNKTYIPLTILSFNIEHRLFGLNPLVFHLDNLILHMLVCVLIFALVRCLGLATLTAFLTALLFGIHPMHVESVAWVTERKDVLYSLFYVLGLIMYCQYIKNNDQRAWIICVAAGFLSLLAKPMALSFPLILWLLDWLLKRRWSVHVFLDKIPFALFIPIVWLTYSLNILPNTTPLVQSALIWVWSFSFYLIKFFIPVGLTPIYTLPYPVALTNPAYPIALAVAALFIFAVVRFRNNRWFIFAALYYVLSIFFLLRMNDVAKNLGASIVADRFMYLPSLGICLWLAHALVTAIKTHPNKRVLLIVPVAAAIIFLGVKTFHQCGVWKDDMTLWNDIIGRGQEIALVYNSRGTALIRRGHKAEALNDYNKAITLDPQYALPYYNRGKVYAESNDLRQALVEYNRALEINPRHIKSLVERGIVYSKTNQLDLALADFNKAIDLEPHNAGTYTNRGIIYSKMGQWKAALADYSRTLSLNPQTVEAYINRGNVLKNLKRYDEALTDFRQAEAMGFTNAGRYVQEVEALKTKENIK